ncbi:MAG: LPS export ABC transporter periplasmic protein LptC [Elusimicrobia bacterium RIFOXYA2_FULL_50_26]|nr:MAG: LPS export ABC transporter periplasmic protein LptC [Elusimicrobia bacterium RIFOXYA2_FULL_50_26]OGS24015.1 MAG: LPS export ABC transporter periplasmic protein LptC [Elusimicrobia bacterium RIFOXYB2_FULL_50_12]
MNNLTLNLILLLSALFFTSCAKREEITNDNPAVPEQAIEQFTVMETRHGKPSWTLDAASAQIIETEKIAIVQSPKIMFYQEGKYVSTLVAERGRINTETYDIWGEEKCIVTTAKGERLETRNLHYRSDIRKIITDEKVKLVRPQEIIYGQGMEATPDLESIIIKKQRVELKEGDEVKK